MRYHEQGAFYRVTVTEHEVWDFASQWPCFGAVAPISFTFDARTNDLVEHNAREDMDDAGVRALADDAQEYARYRINQELMT